MRKTSREKAITRAGGAAAPVPFGRKRERGGGRVQGAENREKRFRPQAAERNQPRDSETDGRA